jgi:MFS family permease
MLEEARAGMAAFGRYRGLRLFTAARGLLLAVELSVPFLVVFSRDELAAGDVLAVAIISIGLANLLSNYAWGRIADRISTRVTMIVAGILGALAIGAALIVAGTADRETTILAFAPIFFFATAAEAGIRVGRKAWVVNAAPDPDRPLWVAATNTLAGLVTLSFAALGGLAELTSVTTVIWTLLGLALAGILAAALMPEDQAVARD